MKLDEKWIRAHLPEEIREEDIELFSGLYLDGLKVMSRGKRGDPDAVHYEAKDEEDLKWWQLDYLCRFLGKTDRTKTWRWYRDHAENGQWYYIEHRHYDYNAIEDPRLSGFERYLRNVKAAFPEDRFQKEVKERVGLMNRWYLVPHWDYDCDQMCFVEISDSKEYKSDFDQSEEPKAGTVVQVVD